MTKQSAPLPAAFETSVPQIVGVVNITADSFSDGGNYLEADAAIAHALELLADGADVIDLGAAASNPRAAVVSAREEIARLAPVVAHLKKIGARISIDSTKPEVQRWAIGEGVEFLNDIRGFPDAGMYPELARSGAKLIVMHAISGSEKAETRANTSREVLLSIQRFFTERLAALRAAGISDDRLILDPGMGFFLSSKSEPSFAVLAALGALGTAFGLPLFIGVSRKSFLQKAGGTLPLDIEARTLSAELYAAAQGVSYIRTHNVRKLREALRVRMEVAAVIESSDYSLDTTV